MKGDFSRWDPVDGQNLNGVLHQQGRVLLDRDWNDQTRIVNAWQDEAARQIIGARVAAVSAYHPEALKVAAADVADGGPVTLQVHPGRAWADGLAVHLPGDPATPLTRVATYLQPPIQDPAAGVDSIDAGVHDAVILEAWRETLNGFQVPKDLEKPRLSGLLEPALGGPDTTERIHTSLRFRLFRLAPGQTCHDILDHLQDDPAQQGHLTVTLEPEIITPGDCPVVQGGGYVGFEHHLYRVEMAQLPPGDPAMFKWSAFNGGLVGRGRWDRTDPLHPKLTLTANDQAIKTSGLTTFYLEVVEYDTDQGYWRVSYGADVTRVDDDLEITNERFADPVPGVPADTVFFRLWNAIRPLTDFPPPPPGGDPNALQDGIRLAFDPDTGANYRLGDYWTFEVRAGDIAHPEPLIDDQPPEGIRYHRVPLAEVHWQAPPPSTITFEAGEIEDCREIFRPLIDQETCCTYTVGDGVRSHGDFRSIEQALRHLPPEGGKICVLPGVHTANVEISNRQQVQISGCGVHSIVLPRPERIDEPIVHIESSRHIQIDHLTLSAPTGTAIAVVDQGADAAGRPGAASQALSFLHNTITAYVHGIEIRVFNEKAGDNDVHIANNRIGMVDRADGRAAIFTEADGVWIERNRIVVVPAPEPDDPDDPRNDPDDPTIELYDPCADPTIIYTPAFPLFTYLHALHGYIDAFAVLRPRRAGYQTWGGIQIGGGSERVRVRDNEIFGGRGNGVTLGALPTFDELPAAFTLMAFIPSERYKEAARNAHAQDGRFTSYLYHLTIAGNTIRGMGLSGVGVAGYFDLDDPSLIVRVRDVTIYQNLITACAHQLPALPSNARTTVAFGGVALLEAEHISIRENRIEHNGRDHTDPVCGVFIQRGQDIDVSDNRIIENGPLTASTLQVIAQSVRAGIFVGLGTKVPYTRALTNALFVEDDGLPAVRVHDNVVLQPWGQALVLMALGPISVQGNHFTAMGVDVAGNPFARYAGAVLILSLGSQDKKNGVEVDDAGNTTVVGLNYKTTYHGIYTAPAYYDANNEGNILTTNTPAGGDVLFEINQDAYVASYGLDNGIISSEAWVANTPAPFMPRTTVLFTDNRTFFYTPPAQRLRSHTTIASVGDVAYNSNQAVLQLQGSRSEVPPLLVATRLIGDTVRSNDNRLQERYNDVYYSLDSRAGLMNTAMGNQSSHCLQVQGPTSRLVTVGNIVRWNTRCRRVGYGSLQLLD